MFNFKQPAYVVIDPELVKQIGIKDFDHFVNHNEALTGADRLFNKTLFALHNNEWRDMRTTLSPVFTSSKMKMMFGLLSDQAREFLQFFVDRAESGESLKNVDVLDVFARFTADGISTAVLGFEADCVRNRDSFIYKTARRMINELFGPIGNLKFTFSLVMPKLYKVLGIQCISKETYEFLREIVIDVMKERDKKNIFRPDVIQLLLQAKKGQLKRSEDDVNEENHESFAAITSQISEKSVEKASTFTDDDWIAQGFVFLGAG
jgi:cytochrome P450 family 9